MGLVLPLYERLRLVSPDRESIRSLVPLRSVPWLHKLVAAVIERACVWY